MRIELQNERGEPVRDVPWEPERHAPAVVTFGPNAYQFHHAASGRMVYRQVFTVILEAFLAGTGLSPFDPESQARWERA